MLIWPSSLKSCVYLMSMGHRLGKPKRDVWKDNQQNHCHKHEPKHWCSGTGNKTYVAACHALDEEQVEPNGRRDQGHFPNQTTNTPNQIRSIPAERTKGSTTASVSPIIEMPSMKHPRIIYMTISARIRAVAESSI